MLRETNFNIYHSILPSRVGVGGPPFARLSEEVLLNGLFLLLCLAAVVPRKSVCLILPLCLLGPSEEEEAKKHKQQASQNKAESGRANVV